MRRGVAYSSQAKAQLKALYLHVAQQSSPDTAWRFVEDLTSRLDILAEFPKLGRARDDLRQSLRMMAFDRRIAVTYKVSGSRVTIVSVFSRGQDFEAALRAAPEVDD